MGRDNPVPGEDSPDDDAGAWRSPDNGTSGRALPGIDPRLLSECESEETAGRPPRGGGIDRERTPGKRGFWRSVGYLLGGPISAVGMDNITESASVIRGLAQRIRTGPSRETRVRIFDNRTLNVEATAFNAGASVAEEVRLLIANRRRQTRRAVFCYLAGAIGFFSLWVWQAITTLAYTRLFYVILLLLICGLFCLLAFYNALVNWQCRTERLGTWRDFLSADESWWPS